MNVSKELLLWLLANSEDYAKGLSTYLDEVESMEAKKTEK